MITFRTVCNVVTGCTSCSDRGGEVYFVIPFARVAVEKCCNAMLHLQMNHCNACGMMNIGLSVNQQFLILAGHLPSSYCAERTSPVPTDK